MAWPVEKFPSYVSYEGGRFGRKIEIFFQEEFEKDPVLQGRPIVLQSKDGHASWVSKLILDETLPLPDSVDGGVIVRDEKSDATGGVPRR